MIHLLIIWRITHKHSASYNLDCQFEFVVKILINPASMIKLSVEYIFHKIKTRGKPTQKACYKPGS